ncbi:hypothetical protein C9374_007992 [Naegleria lovaniensis]|uniref:Smr domain-containing protein n=1 Tax=Naegleria lovaniensis TaxID=51637 RepID=A0AA88GJV0_NAELO|nr:uncharacterized protein C9374_007992 [Naegleria lovaniensis]KAG2378844.1 hypothetical protein C9374_007992 [Naegleria lovaniensis]
MLAIVLIVFLSFLPVILQQLSGKSRTCSSSSKSAITSSASSGSQTSCPVVNKTEINPVASVPVTSESVKEEIVVERVAVVSENQNQSENSEASVNNQNEDNEVSTTIEQFESSSQQETIVSTEMESTRTSNNKEDTTQFQSNLDESNGSFILKPSKIVKYIIGPSGSVIKQIMSETNSRIDISDRDETSKLVKISGSTPSSFNLQKTYQRLMDELNKYGWKYESEHDEFVEHLTESMKLFKELEKKIKEQSDLMSKCFEEASKAFERGEKALASQLSEEGKRAQELMKQYQNESAQTMFDHLNKDKSQDEIDLHGQYVDFAMKFLKERIEQLKQDQKNELTIIYGAGNHSDENGPKIKPAVLKYLNEMQMKYEEKTQGSILATLV